MDKALFDRLVESMTQMDEIVKGERQPSREVVIDAVKVKAIRKNTGLTQQRFAKLIDVNVGTLRNWEQGRREPTGPAKALLRAIERDPKHVLAALS
ncbi:helix-turn-helix domain-containing protein [Zobellella taiwanensis]|jgi:putative transcriptional regulator|uniref:Transcriptional regulator n=1 Tax=Zobellella taiwanensis TaxID=347535 RepID=A0A2P7R9M8_9GAMM|nr:helix-turn-helix domain-containing protein [Zobellella taiwanensis]PSJ46926.1 transcriptional regulator [Zobellella taiwanensis]